MATIRKKDNADGTFRWEVQIRLQGFPTVTHSEKRKTDAKEWAQKIEADMKAGRYFPERAAAKQTLTDLIDRYIRDVCPRKKDGDKQVMQLEVWKAKLGKLAVVDITPNIIAKARDELAAEVIQAAPNAKPGTKRSVSKVPPRRRSGATINRYLAALSHAFTVGVREWGMGKDNPVKRVSRSKEAKGIVRFLDERERERLLKACTDGPSFLYPLVMVALCTAMRQGEILGLRWRDIDLDARRLVLHDTKNGERRGVSLAKPAVEQLRLLNKVRDIEDDTVFPPYHVLIRAWDRAIVKAKIDKFRFHDLRHTAASYLAMNGASTSEIAEVTGHKTLAMVKRYAHLSTEHTLGVVDRMADKFLGSVGRSGGSS